MAGLRAAPRRYPTKPSENEICAILSSSSGKRAMGLGSISRRSLLRRARRAWEARGGALLMFDAAPPVARKAGGPTPHTDRDALASGAGHLGGRRCLDGGIRTRNARFSPGGAG